LITTKSDLDNAAAAAPARALETTPPVRRKPFWKRKLASVSRWLHIYLSMASFAILFFFAATGFTLNHQDWFASQQKTVQSRGLLNAEWLKGAVDKLQVVEYLRRNGIHGAVDDFHIEDSQCSVSFKGPGYEADIVLDRRTGAYDITETRAGFVAIVNDLHKGRDTGQSWSKVIDVAALFMSAVSLTGLILIFFLHKRRVSGLLLLAAGGVLGYLIYVVWVP
jgi:hypothetical protein